jgi:hypothetical protein
MNSLGLKPMSGAIPHRTLSSYPAACQPIYFLSFLRSSNDRRREDERVEAIAASGDWVQNKAKGSSAKRGDQVLCEKGGMRSVGLPAQHLPPFTPTHATFRENVVRGARCLHPPRATYTNNDR